MWPFSVCLAHGGEPRKEAVHMAKKSKKIVVRDEDFAELDAALDDALQSLDAVNQKTLGVLEAIDQGQLELIQDGTPEADQANSGPDQSAE